MEDEILSYESLVRLLAANIYRAYYNSTGSQAPFYKEQFERHTNPVPGDVVIEITSMVRKDWPRHAIGVLQAIEHEPTYTPGQWAEVCESEAERYERLKQEGREVSFGGGDWIDEWLLRKGPRKVTDPIPTDAIYVIVPFLSEHTSIRWGNCRMVAGAYDPTQWPEVSRSDQSSDSPASSGTVTRLPI